MPYKDPEKRRMQRAEYAREDRAYFKALNRCTECHGQDAYTLNGRIRCAECAEKINAYMREYRRKNGEKMRAYDRRHTAGRKEARRCVRCGRDMGEDHHVNCEYCRAKDAERQREKRASRRGEVGVCYVCAKAPVMEGRRVCAACYEKVCRNAANARGHVRTGHHPWRRDEELRIMSITGRLAT